MQKIPTQEFPKPKPKPHSAVYLETSVLVARATAGKTTQLAPTHDLWDFMEAGCCRFVASEVVEKEANRGYEKTKNLFDATFSPRDILPLTSDAIALANQYIAHGVLTANHFDDACQVAICTLAGIRWLVSWNFHYVKPERSAKFNRVNHLHGLPFVYIVQPHEYLIQSRRSL